MKICVHFMLIIFLCAAMSAAARAQSEVCNYSQGCCPGQADCCASDCCPNCFDCCNSGRTGLSGGASLYLISPYAQDNQAYSRTSGFSTPNRDRITSDFAWDYKASPGFWLGWQQPNSWGLRSRLFLFQQNSLTADQTLDPTEANDVEVRPSQRLPDMDIVNPGFQGSPGILLSQGLGMDTLHYSSELTLYNLDLELTHEVCCGPSRFLFSGGGRYMHMSQRYDQSLFNTVTIGADTATETSLIDFVHNFNGAGPTAAFEVTRQLGCSQFSFFGSVRGSLLVGSTTRTLSFNEAVVDPGDIGGGSQTRASTANANGIGAIGVGEIELGVEYAMRLEFFDTFARLSVVDQTYFGAGNASTQDGSLSLFGGQVSVGVMY